MTTVTLAPTAVTSCTATAADPIDVTKATHGFSTGTVVLATGFTEMTELNGGIFSILEGADANSLFLKGATGAGGNINGSTFDAETTGGTLIEAVSPVLTIATAGEDITFAITGTWVGTIQFQREKSPHSDIWETVAQYTANVSRVWQQTRENERYRGVITAYTSGSPTISISDGDKVLDSGDGIIEFTQAGAAVTGTLSVSGAITATGGVAGDITGNVAGDLTGDANAGAITGTDASLDIVGQAAAQGGAVSVTGGASSTSANAGGAASIAGGAAGATGAGGAVAATAAAGGATSGAGGAADITAGGGTAGNGAGGKATLTGGTAHGSGAGGAVVVTAGGTTSGVGGQVHLRSDTDTPVLIKRAVAGTGTDAETLTVAELFNGIFLQTPSAAATTCTTPTGAQISAALSATLAVGDSFEFTLINLGGTTAYDITLTAGASGVTITGSAILAPAADDPSEASSGTWVFVNTAADTWVAYRK